MSKGEAPSTRMIEELLKRHHGILKLQPTYVHRFYPDLNRLGQPGFKSGANRFIPERWIGSSVEAINPDALPGGGLSMLAGAARPLALRDAIRSHAETMLGEECAQKWNREFPVLVKILDPGEPIVFHLHATDAQVKRMPRHFRGHRFGKDEAYYFLDAPKGPAPYTHVGLHEGVTRRELIDAVRKGRDHALELSPVIYQEFGQGFFVPAGVPHRPGTALTLEIQQPSDVYTLLETHSAGKAMPPAQIHPGFKSLDEAFELIDMILSHRVGRLGKNRLSPKRNHSSAGGEIAWIFPPEVCKKFGGKRIRVNRHVSYSETSAFLLLTWRGRVKINGLLARAGSEFFVTRNAAQNIAIENIGDEVAELFTFFPTL